MISPRLAAVSFALAAALPAFAASYDGEAPFEKAAETSTVKLGPSDAAPPAEKEVRCFYFPRLMVKELDEREIGDTRAVTGSCSVLTGGDKCWQAIRAKLQMPESPAPECRSGYEAALRRAAEEACREQGGDKVSCLKRETDDRGTDWNAAPTVVSYDVDVTLGSTDAVARNFAGGPVACWPAD